MLCGKQPSSLLITTGAEMGVNYGGCVSRGSLSPSSTSSSSPCPSTPSSSTHSFNLHYNHFHQHHRIGDGIPSLTKPCGMGWDRRPPRFVARKGRGGNYWQQMPNGPPFMHHPHAHPHGPPSFLSPHPPPPFPPPPGVMFPPPPFFPPPPYTSSGGHIDTSVPPPPPPPPYSMMSLPPPPFFPPFPPPPLPLFNFPPNSNKRRSVMQPSPPPQKQERKESRPVSREGANSLASTELSYGDRTEDDSYDTSPEEETFHQLSPPAQIDQGKRSYLVRLRPQSQRDEPVSSPPPISHKEFETFTSIYTRGNKNVKDTEIMDTFIVEYMKNMKMEM